MTRAELFPWGIWPGSSKFGEPGLVPATLGAASDTALRITPDELDSQTAPWETRGQENEAI